VNDALIRVAPGVVLNDKTVNFAGVVTPLQTFVAKLGQVRRALHEDDLVVTSGKDGNHAAGSLHAEGRAVDLRQEGASGGFDFVWLMAIIFLAPLYYCTVFDEHGLPGAGHIHIEYHG